MNDPIYHVVIIFVREGRPIVTRAVLTLLLLQYVCTYIHAPTSSAHTVPVINTFVVYLIVSGRKCFKRAQNQCLCLSCILSSPGEIRSWIVLVTRCKGHREKEAFASQQPRVFWASGTDMERAAIHAAMPRVAHEVKLTLQVCRPVMLLTYSKPLCPECNVLSFRTLHLHLSVFYLSWGRCN
jgi:hypothetical protein